MPGRDEFMCTQVCLAKWQHTRSIVQSCSSILDKAGRFLATSEMHSIDNLVPEALFFFFFFHFRVDEKGEGERGTNEIAQVAAVLGDHEKRDIIQVSSVVERKSLEVSEVRDLSEHRTGSLAAIEIELFEVDAVACKQVQTGAHQRIPRDQQLAQTLLQIGGYDLE